MKKKTHTTGGETLLVQVSKRDFNRFEKVSRHLNTPIEQLARRILSDVIECEYYDMKATLKN